MLYFVFDEAYTLHLTGPQHVESPQRVLYINKALETAGLKTIHNSLQPRSASPEELSLCHDAAYIQKVEKETSALQEHDVRYLSTGDAVISRNSFEIAKLAVGGAFTAIDCVFENPHSKAFCIVRPPGHHASKARGAGFCLFNNVALAARYAQKSYGIKRILIADWDVHHGDGTQAIFYRDPSVFYFSTHEEGNYPGTGKKEETGKVGGKGFTLNVPILPGPRSREAVLLAFRTQLKEAMHRFQPELILISCGFDGHEDDPLGHFNLTDADFGTLTEMMLQIAHQYAQGRLVSILEGGYNLQAIARASVTHAQTLIKWGA